MEKKSIIAVGAPLHSILCYGRDVQFMAITLEATEEGVDLDAALAAAAGDWMGLGCERGIAPATWAEIADIPQDVCHRHGFNLTVQTCEGVLASRDEIASAWRECSFQQEQEGGGLKAARAYVNAATGEITGIRKDLLRPGHPYATKETVWFHDGTTAPVVKAEGEMPPFDKDAPIYWYRQG